MTTAYLALGANLGDRAANLRHAAALLERDSAVRIVARSAIYETQSVEDGGPHDFLNAALRIETTLSARELLALIGTVESTLGRPQPPRHGPRLVDVDILIFGAQRFDEPDLQIPHPRMHGRTFVLRPLLDVLEGATVEKTAESW